jgi:ATP-dependent 26S proteasome regulatory subunit
VGWGVNEIGERVPLTAPLGRLALTEDVQDAVSAIERWFKSKDWYAERQIPWRFGLGLHGVPGTGKSSLVKALAQHLRIPIYLLDISTMDNEEFHNAYQTALANTPAVVLIEDIDAVFKGRENIAAEKGKGLTFDCLLNVISGVESSDGLLLVITTNHIEDVDDALGVPKGDSLSSRPGRIDRMVEMPLLNLDGRRRLATRILAGCHPSWVDYMVSDGGFETGAQFEDRCATLALNLFWSKDPQRPAPEVDEERSVA